MRLSDGAGRCVFEGNVACVKKGRTYGAKNKNTQEGVLRHTISLLVENEFGVLARIAGLFSGRGFNIESLTVAETLDPVVSRITLVTRGDDQIVAQINKQLNKLVSVIEVQDFTEASHVERELALIKVAADQNTRAEIMNIVDIFRGKVID